MYVMPESNKLSTCFPDRLFVLPQVQPSNGRIHHLNFLIFANKRIWVHFFIDLSMDYRASAKWHEPCINECTELNAGAYPR